MKSFILKLMRDRLLYKSKQRYEASYHEFLSGCLGGKPPNPDSKEYIGAFKEYIGYCKEYSSHGRVPDDLLSCYEQMIEKDLTTIYKHEDCQAIKGKAFLV